MIPKSVNYNIYITGILVKNRLWSMSYFKKSRKAIFKLKIKKYCLIILAFASWHEKKMHLLLKPTICDLESSQHKKNYITNIWHKHRNYSLIGRIKTLPHQKYFCWCMYLLLLITFLYIQVGTEA